MNWAFWLEIAALFLTVMVLLYLLIGDNALFRLVTYLFVGAAAGYVAVVVIFQVLIPRFFNLFNVGNLTYLLLGLIPFVFGALLLFKLIPRFSGIASLSMAILVGVGAAVAVGGAIFGTIAGQISGTISLFRLNQGGDVLARLAEGVFVVFGTISTLAYFQFSTRSRAVLPDQETHSRRDVLPEVLAKIGQVFIGVTLGAMFAGVYAASLSALVERIGFIIRIVTKFL